MAKEGLRSDDTERRLRINKHVILAFKIGIKHQIVMGNILIVLFQQSTC